MDERQLKIKLKKLYFALSTVDPESDLAIKLENEIEYLELSSKGQILCAFHPSEGCDRCKFIEECDLRE